MGNSLPVQRYDRRFFSPASLSGVVVSRGDGEPSPGLFRRGLLLLLLFLVFAGSGETLVAQVVDAATIGRISRGNQSRQAREAMADLQQLYPGVMESRPDRATTLIFGTPMTAAEDPWAAAELWLLDHSGALNGDLLSLEGLDDFEICRGLYHVFRYRQWLSGSPVEDSNLRIVVSNGVLSRVVLVSARLAPALTVEVRDMVVPIGRARSIAEGIRREGTAWKWSDGQLVARVPSGEVTHTQLFWTWIVRGGTFENPVEETIRVRADGLGDAESENLICFQDATGNLQGNATAGMLPPDLSSVSARPLPTVEVALDLGSITHTDQGGDFIFPGVSGDRTVSASLSGLYAHVITVLGTDLSESQSGPVSEPFDLFFNTGGTLIDTAQVNAFLHATRTHDFMKDRLPGFTALDLPIVCNVNLAQTCNAFFSPSELSLNFFRTGGGCSNSAYSSVIAHEYGHFVVNRLNLGQSTFGEGYSDSLAILSFDDPVVGRNFFDTGAPIRDIGTAGVTYPCAGQIHFCGQLLAGCWWDLRQNLGNSLGSIVGLDVVRQLFADWSAVTIGGEAGAGTAYSATAIEVLTVDDDDGNLENGTPHYSEICASFLGRGIPCPQVVALSITFPLGLPEVLDSSGTPLRVQIEEIGSTVVPGQIFLQFWVDGGPLQVIPFSPLLGDEYEAVFPPMNCGSLVEYTVSAQDTQGVVHVEPTPFEQCGVGNSLEVFLVDPIESVGAWSGSAPGDTALFGQWDHGDPVGTEIQPEFDHTVDPGVNCWVTGQGVPGGPVGANDIDLGMTTLTSPAFDCSQPGVYRFSCWRWFDNNSSFSPPDDDLVIEVSSDGGTSWVEAERIGPGHPEASGGWFRASFWLNSLVVPSAQVRVRIIAEDTGNGNLVEAAIDDLTIERILCSGGPTPTDADFLRGDCNSDGGVNISDPILLLERLFATASIPPCEDSCDANDDGVLNLTDVVLMLEAVFGFGSGTIADPALICGADPSTDNLQCQLPSLCP